LADSEHQLLTECITEFSPLRSTIGNFMLQQAVHKETPKLPPRSDAYRFTYSISPLSINFEETTGNAGALESGKKLPVNHELYIPLNLGKEKLVLSEDTRMRLDL
jgi:hypothetical protein